MPEWIVFWSLVHAEVAFVTSNPADPILTEVRQLLRVFSLSS